MSAAQTPTQTPENGKRGAKPAPDGAPTAPDVAMDTDARAERLARAASRVARAVGLTVDERDGALEVLAPEGLTAYERKLGAKMATTLVDREYVADATALASTLGIDLPKKYRSAK